MLVWEICDTSVAVCHVKWQGLYRSNSIIGPQTFRRDVFREEIMTYQWECWNCHLQHCWSECPPLQGYFLPIWKLPSHRFLLWRHIWQRTACLAPSSDSSTVPEHWMSSDHKFSVTFCSYQDQRTRPGLFVTTHFTQWIRVFRDQLIINQLISKFTSLHRFSWSHTILVIRYRNG